MGYLTSALVVAVLVGLLVLRRVLVVRRFANRDREWMPAALANAKLVWSEKTFRCEHPVPIVARVDRVYRVGDGPLTLIEFKRRAACRTYLSDMVELSAQRFVLQRAGYAVSRTAFVAVLPWGRGRCHAIRVELEDVRPVESRAVRLKGLIGQQLVPGGPVNAAVCRSCSHQDDCRRTEQTSGPRLPRSSATNRGGT